MRAWGRSLAGLAHELIDHAVLPRYRDDELAVCALAAAGARLVVAMGLALSWLTGGSLNHALSRAPNEPEV